MRRRPIALALALIVLAVTIVSGAAPGVALGQEPPSEKPATGMPEAATSQIDWNLNARSNRSLEFEGGWSITKEWRVWAHPGVGLWGRDVFGNYDWIMQVGVRRMFASY